MSYQQSLLNLVGKCYLIPSNRMATSTCFDFGVFEESVICLQGKLNLINCLFFLFVLFINFLLFASIHFIYNCFHLSNTRVQRYLIINWENTYTELLRELYWSTLTLKTSTKGGYWTLKSCLIIPNSCEGCQARWHKYLLLYIMIFKRWKGKVHLINTGGQCWRHGL